MKIQAPFTPEQVAALNAWQANGAKPPITCQGRKVSFNDDNGERIEGRTRAVCPDEGTLIATPEGWVCPCGLYEQKWAHDFMTETI